MGLFTKKSTENVKEATDAVQKLAVTDTPAAAPAPAAEVKAELVAEVKAEAAAEVKTEAAAEPAKAEEAAPAEAAAEPAAAETPAEPAAEAKVEREYCL